MNALSSLRLPECIAACEVESLTPMRSCRSCGQSVRGRLVSVDSWSSASGQGLWNLRSPNTHESIIRVVGGAEISEVFIETNGS